MGIFRTFLAICVILAHSNPSWKMEFLPGDVAVKTFFIISGFYMSLILDSKYAGMGSYRLFITNRFLRIYPVYWAVLILTIFISIVSGVMTHHWIQLASYMTMRHHMGPIALVALVISNLVIFGQDIVMFLGLNIKAGTVFFTENFRNTSYPFYLFLFIPQAWTLALELMFYMIAPFILNKNIWLVLCLIAASLLFREYMCRGLRMPWDPWTFRLFPAELLFFLLGNISYRIYGHIKDKQGYLRMGNFITPVFFLIALIYPNIHYLIERKVSFAPYYCFAFISVPFIFNLTRNSRKDNRMGELSYPIYLVHYLVIQLIGVILISASNNLRISLTIILSVLAAFILLKLMVDPIDKFRQYRWARQVKS